MSLKRSLIKNTGFNLVGYFYLLVASFFSVSIILNNLGRDVFGVYIFLVAFISLSAVIDFGISTAVVRKLSLPDTTPDERIKVWKTSFAIFVVLAFILSVSVFFLLHYLSNTMPIFSYLNKSTISWTIVALTVIVFVNHINTHLLSLPQAEQRFEIFNSKTLIVGTGNTIVSAVISGLYPSVSIIFLTQLIFHFLTFIFMISYSVKRFPGKAFAPKYDKNSGRELFSFGLRNFVATLAGQIENQFSNFILGAMVSARAITAFSIPQSIVAKGAGVVSQFAQVFFPFSTSLLHKDRIHKLKRLVLGVEAVTLFGGILAVILSYTIGHPFLMWWLKDSIVVDAAYPVLKILSFYFVLVSLTPVPTVLLQSLNKPQIPSFFGALTVILEIIFSLFLISYGPVGVAYAFLGSVCITVPWILIVTWRQLKIETVRLTEV